MKNLKGKKKGFTLIELVVVVTIIGILAVLMVPRFLTMAYEARISTFVAQHRTIVSAMSMYGVRNAGSPPQHMSDLKDYMYEIQTAVVSTDAPAVQQQKAVLALVNKPAGAYYMIQYNSAATPVNSTLISFLYDAKIKKADIPAAPSATGISASGYVKIGNTDMETDGTLKGTAGKTDKEVDLGLIANPMKFVMAK